MNQEKIGNYIKLKRKNKKITQEQLSEKLGVSNKAVSNWENGKNMPDLSLFKPLCEILDISINELISGEDLKKEEYINTLEENIINVINDTNKKRKRLLLIPLTSIILFIAIIIILILEINIKYEYTNITCTNNDKYITLTYKGDYNNYTTSKTINNEFYYIINSKINIFDIPNNYKNNIKNNIQTYKESFEKIYSKTYIYYSNESINKINKMTNKEFLDYLDNLNLVCSF